MFEYSNHKKLGYNKLKLIQWMTPKTSVKVKSVFFKTFFLMKETWFDYLIEINNLGLELGVGLSYLRGLVRGFSWAQL